MATEEKRGSYGIALLDSQAKQKPFLNAELRVNPRTSPTVVIVNYTGWKRFPTQLRPKPDRDTAKAILAIEPHLEQVVHS
jgi:hypothetical protein